MAAPLTGRMFQADPVGAAAALLVVGTLAMLGLTEALANPGSVAAGLLRGHKDTRVYPWCLRLQATGPWAPPLGLRLADGADLCISGLWVGLAAGTAVMSALMIARVSRG